MAIKIRLKRIGRRNRPFYRVVVMDSRKRRDGAAIEELGWYNPIARDKDSNFVLKEDRVFHWLTVGAQPTDAVNGLMKRAGLALKWHLTKQGLDEDSIRKEMEKWELNKENRKKPAKVEKPAEVVEPAPSVEAEEPETAVEEEKTESTPPEENLPGQEEAPTEPSTDKPEETEVSATDGDNTSESSESESKPSDDDTPETEESTDEKQTEEGGDQAEEK